MTEGLKPVSRTAYYAFADRNVANVVRMPRWLLATVFREVRDGYSLAAFEAAPAGGPA